MGSTPSQSGTTLFHEEPNKKEEYKIEFGELEGQPILGSADGEIGLR